jgi:hypothetical protein
MIRASLVHPQEVLHEHSFDGCGVARHTNQNCFCLEPPEVGQVMPETRRGFKV